MLTISDAKEIAINISRHTSPMSSMNDKGPGYFEYEYPDILTP